jgi:signal transduction histidine kinase/DNA-binding response OmpR family regulator
VHQRPIQIILLEESDVITREVFLLLTQEESLVASTDSRSVDPREAIFELKRAVSHSECLELLRHGDFSVILCSYALSQQKGGEKMRELLTSVKDLPILIHGRELPVYDVAAIIATGVQDYIEISSITSRMLRSTILNAIERAKLRKTLRSEGLHKSEFLARMSHEIRTPITSIIGFAEVLSDDELEEFDRKDAAQTILRNSKFLLGLIDDILDFSRIESGKLQLHIERLPLSVLLNDVSALLKPKANQKGIDISIEPLFPLPVHVYTDAIRLEQILLNLGGNAIKFSFEGQVRITVHFDKETNKLVFHVKDSGIGIDQARIEMLFNPFTQADSSIKRDFGGTGLGLAICRSLSEALGGEISAVSRKGHGSDFSFMVDVGDIDHNALVDEFPVSTTAPSKKNLYTNRSTSEPRALVLVVEDVKDTQDLLRFYLKRAGLSCIIAPHGKKALQLVSQHKFDLILMDMQMPIMDGFETVKRLRQQRYQKPIVALTASATQECRRSCLDVGCNAHLTKPFSRDAFLTCIEEFLPLPKGETLESRLETFRTDPSYLMLVDRFRDGLLGKLLAIDEARSKEKFDQLEDLAHRLASAAMFGFSEISTLARQIETASAERQIDVLDTNLEKLSSVVEAIVRYESEII